MIFLKKIDVLIIFEHISRELETCLYLKFELQKRGLKCELAPLHFNRYLTNIKFKPKLVILPFLNSNADFTLRHLREVHGEEVIALNLHHEQLYNDSTKKFMLPKDEYSRDAYHLAWTKNFATDLEESGVAQDKIRVLCNPRFDSFWLKSNANLLYGKKFEEIIFFPTTFAWAFVSEDYFLSIGHMSKENFYRIRGITDQAARAYFKDISELAIKYPEKLFLVRPHPYEDISYFIKKFMEYSGLMELPENICIERKGNVYECIKVSSVIIGWCTTTNIEAAMCNKCSIVYHPTEYPTDMDLSFFKDFMICKDFNELDEIISATERPLVSADIKNKFSVEYGFPLEPVCPAIAAWVDDILNKPSHASLRTDKLFFVKNLSNFLIRDIPKFFLVKLKIMHLLNRNYSGLYEDCMTYGRLRKSFEQFKKNNG